MRCPVRVSGYHRRMEDTVDTSVSRDAAALLDALTVADFGVALVGGAVRDVLMGRAVHDLDVVTDAAPGDVRAMCEGAPWCRNVYAIGERYGTVGVVLADGVTVEVSRLRGESACGVAQSPSTTFAERFAADAAHRDFTVNAMAAEWPGLVLLDPTGGQADLAARLLRAPGDPAERFAEDPLRVLRAARFVAELDFDVSPATAAAMSEAACAVCRVAAERVRDELTALLVAPHAPRGLGLLLETGALAVVLPEVAALDGVTQPTFHDLDVLAHTMQTVGCAPQVRVMRWAALLHDLGKARARTIEADGRIRFFRHAQLGAELADEVSRRLRLSNVERIAIVHLVREHMRLGELPLDNPRAVDRAVRKLDLWVPNADPARRIVTAEDALELEIADFAATAHREEAPERQRVLAAAIAASRERGTRRPPTAPLDGRELMHALGLSEGPLVGQAMRAIAEAVADSRLDPGDRDGALKVAREALGRP